MYCGIDLGSSSLKCLIIDDTGRLRSGAKAGVGNPLFGRNGTSDTILWRKALKEAIAQAIAGIPEGASAIQALAISGNGPSLVCLDKADRVIGPARLWTDRSASAEAAAVNQLAARLGLGGPAIDASFYLPKAIQALEQARHNGTTPPARFFSAPEYLAFCLGAEPVSYLPAPYYDRFIWFSSLHPQLGLDSRLFPPYVEGGKLIGQVSLSGQTEFGFRKGTPIVSAWPDFLSGLVGSGTMRTGIACDRSGSSEALNLCTDRALAGSGLFCLPHVAPGLWNASGGVSSSGRILIWVQQLLGFASLEDLLAAARHAGPGSSGLVFLPYLDGERAPLWDTSLRPLWQGLHEKHSREDLARSALEGIVFGLKLTMEIFADCGQAPREIRLSGAAAKNDFVAQLKADIFGQTLSRLSVAEAECLGAACACRLALGQCDSLAEASEQLVRLDRQFEPDSDLHHGVYQETWQLFKKALQTARQAFSTERTT